MAKRYILNCLQKGKSIIGLAIQLAKVEFKLRNEGSYLGVFWYLLNPILTFALLFLVFSISLGNNIPKYPLYLLLGIIMFNFFQSSTLESTKLMRDNNRLIKSIGFPRESLIIGLILKNLFSHLFEFIIFICFFICLGLNLISILFYLPIIILFLLFVFGFSLLLSSLAVYFVDLDNIWNFAIRLIWLGTPIFYAIDGQNHLFFFNLINPLYYFITLSRDLVIYNKMPEMWIILGSVGCTLIFFVLGIFVFNKLKIKMAELI